MSGVVGDTGFVYFIVTASASAIKIGAAKDPDARLRALQIGNHERLSLLRTIECDSPEKCEAGFHEALEQARIRGEWFRCDAVLDALDLPRCDFPFVDRVRTRLRIDAAPTVFRQLLEDSEAKRYALQARLSRAEYQIWRCAREIRALTHAADHLLVQLCPWEEPQSDEQLQALEAKWGADW